jgi:HK97 gp10 family phage protein
VARADVRVRVVRNDFPRDAVNVLRTSYRLSEEIANDIATTARRLVPVDTGYLKASIEVLKKVSGSSGYFVNVYADYAVFVEFGTRYQRAQPYLTPAANLARINMVAKATRELRQALR